MFEKFLEDYSDQLSRYGLVFRYIKRDYTLFRFSLVPLTLFFILFVITIVLEKYIIWSSCAVMLSFIYIIYVFFRFNKAAKRIIEIKYGIKPSGFLWNNKDYFLFSNKELKKYLKKRNLLSTAKLQTLVSLLQKEAELRKLPKLLIPGLLLAFAIPVWDKVLDYIYKSAEDINFLIAITLLLFVSICIFTILFSVTKKGFEDFIDILLRRQDMKQIAQRVEYILLEVYVNE